MAVSRSPRSTARPERTDLSQTTTLPIQKPHQAACTCRHRWCPRRIHALGGVVVGLFVAAHLLVAMTGLWPQRYQGLVNQIHRLGHALPVMELTLIFIPLLVQAGYGLRMLAKIGMAYHTERSRAAAICGSSFSVCRRSSYCCSSAST